MVDINTMNYADRVKRISEQFDIYSPPSSGSCDCFNYATDEEKATDTIPHFHIRCVKATCASCKEANLIEDFFSYTLSEACEKMDDYADEMGWGVRRNENFYVCPPCLEREMKKHGGTSTTDNNEIIKTPEIESKQPIKEDFRGDSFNSFFDEFINDDEVE